MDIHLKLINRRFKLKKNYFLQNSAVFPKLSIFNRYIINRLWFFQVELFLLIQKMYIYGHITQRNVIKIKFEKNLYWISEIQIWRYPAKNLKNDFKIIYRQKSGVPVRAKSHRNFFWTFQEKKKKRKEVGGYRTCGTIYNLVL